MEDLASATRFARFASVLSQIAPGERSRFFSTPELDERFIRASYCIEGISPDTFDLTPRDPSSIDPPSRLARIMLAKGSKEYAIPNPDQVELDLELVQRFELGQVKQPDIKKDPNAKLILHPRVPQLPPTIRFYLGGVALGFQERTFELSGAKHSVLVPSTDISRLPTASHSEMLETVSQIEALYVTDSEKFLDISTLEDLHADLNFINTNGDWSIITTDRTILHVGGGSSTHNLVDLLSKSLQGVKNAKVFYELDGQVVLRFCITR
jgi:hypothetical protein